MKLGWIVPPLTNQRQAQAADPGLSAWVSANAGSGKTHVLVNRVLRLLLDGVQPSRMLCITYTKAAAANMANRIFKALGAWATLDEAALAKELTGLTGRAPSLAERAKARRECLADNVALSGNDLRAAMRDCIQAKFPGVQLYARDGLTRDGKPTAAAARSAWATIWPP